MNGFLLLLASFLGSLGVVLLERGLYFYTEDQFGYGQSANLWLGLVLGVCYVAGALGSHNVAHRHGERRALLWMVAILIAQLTVLTAWPTPAMTWVTFPVVGLMSGGMWPIVESFTTAGLAPRRMLTQVGRFCIAWSLAVPIAMAISGPMIESPWPASMFALAVVCYAASFVLFWRLPARAVHTPHDDPQRPDAATMQRYRALMVGSRWSLIGGYALLFLIAPLLPYILVTKLGLDTRVATPAASLMDWTRLLAFALLGWMTFWYGRATPLLICVALLPVAFLMILFGPTLAWVLTGELIFGLANGLVYYAALYYALAAKNAAVEAGGGHEALIGGGFAVGPICGLIGLGLGDLTGGYVQGMLMGVTPLILICIAGGTLPLLKLLRKPLAV